MEGQMAADKKIYRKLTDDVLAEIALKYKSRREFFEEDSSAFVTASRRKILDQICGHMFTRRFLWTKEMTLNEAKKYGSRTAFAKGNKAAYNAAVRDGYFEEACAHMTKRRRKKESTAA
jgi:hypothetical protein